MIYTYNPDDLKSRTKTTIFNDEGRMVFWGIYDFSYKYRTRIYDADDEEIMYVQKEIGLPDEPVVCYDSKGRKLFTIDQERIKLLIDDIRAGKMESDDPLRDIPCLFAAVLLEAE